MKNAKQLLEEAVSGILNEGASGWKRIDYKDGKLRELVRMSGKTFPSILYNYKKEEYFARDNNGKNPSKTLEGKDVNQILNGISKPHPSESDLNWLSSGVDEVTK